MIEPSNPILSKMLDRLFAAVVSGPAMNCRPHNSRQRIDLAQLSRLKDIGPGEALLSLLGDGGAVKIAGRVPATKGDDEAAKRAWAEQQSLVSKLRLIADEARTYGRDTGVHALNVGFPLLSLPPGSFGSRGGIASRRVVAPIAFIPVRLAIKSGTKQSIELACQANGVERVVPNAALWAWIEQQTGQPPVNPFEDTDGTRPWQEIAGLVRAVAARMDLAVPDVFGVDDPPETLTLAETVRADQDETGPAVVTSAVLGLFPASNQGLLNDTRAMIAEGVADGPIAPFVRHGISLETPAADVDPSPVEVERSSRDFSAERLVATADPCQASAVRLARQCAGLVVHGPPGTGKSQTITNVIGDHLAHGERVLFVCDKRTALDVVADRLNALGLGDLCATVHDPQRDQRELYRSLRDQLDNLAETAVKSGSAEAVGRIDGELKTVHDELTAYHDALMGDGGGPGSFHDLMGRWFAERGDAKLDGEPLVAVTSDEFDRHKVRLADVLERGDATAFSTNPWAGAIGVDLPTFLAVPMGAYRSSLDRCVTEAGKVDGTLKSLHPPFGRGDDLQAEGERRRAIGDQLAAAGPVVVTTGSFWAGQSIEAVEKARADLAAAAEWVAEIDARPLTEVPMTIPTAEQLAAEREALSEYIAAFDKVAGGYAAVRAAVPGAPEAVVLRWVVADPGAAAAARKRLDGAAPLAESVERSSPDASLLARWEAAPLGPARRLEALSALNAYLDVARSWTAVFQGAKKKAATPAVAVFGLSLTPESAEAVRAFLLAIQERADLRQAVEAVSGESLGESSPDDQLLTTYQNHRAVVAAVSTASAATVVHLTPEATAAINRAVGPTAERAGAVVTRFGRSLSADTAKAVLAILVGLEARVRVGELLKRLGTFGGELEDRADRQTTDFAGPSGPPLNRETKEPRTEGTPKVSGSSARGPLTSGVASVRGSLASDDELIGRMSAVDAMLTVLAGHRPGTPVGDAIASALGEPATFADLVGALHGSPARAAAILAFGKTLVDAKLFSIALVETTDADLRANGLVLDVMSELADRLPTAEGVIRVKEGLAQLPPPLATAAASLLSNGVPAAEGLSTVHKHVLSGEVRRRLEATPELQRHDAHHLQSSFDRYRRLMDEKKAAVGDWVRQRWVTRQRERLLSKTGTRLNRTATDLRLRLATKGERATRLRQVIAHGATVDGGDPLFDLRPVWMASPETVAQLFARAPIFDVVVFDEASQCRLEEALPVLTRAKRVVIAGDPKQLPPTRFFESAVVRSDEADAETDQEFFETRQGEIEDLLGAALGLDVRQCYLDVHYRSRNAELIGFSNEQFYSSRLQAIPGHPNHRAVETPIHLHHVAGIYDKRQNEAEAKQVCEIVRDLLDRPVPPSIGIACFNLVQRDLIVETLEGIADEDAGFAKKLADARDRRSATASEGLFVKNLENVQGDERDCLIISTTYGPDPVGKFRRNFGPLGTTGGGRRLNVLVTRAREAVHVVTSIPQSHYRSLPVIPDGTSPSGAWLLFAYLAYAERVQAAHEGDDEPVAAVVDEPAVDVRPTRTASTFSRALAERLAADHGLGSVVHWGNEGFGIDVVLRDSRHPADATVGVLCDMTRFGGAEDPVDWDVFRTAVHESQGWQLRRLWTPHFYRDPVEQTAEVARAAVAASGPRV